MASLKLHLSNEQWLKNSPISSSIDFHEVILNALVSSQVPTEETPPSDELIRSAPLPPPIIPETEESTHSPVSDASSGYMSTSLSTVTLSDVYTLSWDLPPSSGFEAVPDEEEEDKKVTQSDTSLQPFRVEPEEAVQISTDSPPSKPDNTDLNVSQQELHHVQEADLVADSLVPLLDKQEQVSVSDHVELHNSEPLEESTLVQEEEAASPSADHPHPVVFMPAVVDGTEPEPPLHTQTPSAQAPGHVQTDVPQAQQPEKEEVKCDAAQDPASTAKSAPALQPPGDPVTDLCQEQLIPQASDTNSTSAPVKAPSDTSTIVATPLPTAQPPRAAILAATPFKIQKVKSSDLKSFQCILGEGEGKCEEVDPADETGLQLSVPTESLEIISDSEEGDLASITVPDWLKEGEFVTVGPNKCGTVRYVGPTEFAKGTWVGVELEVPAGEQIRVTVSH